MSKRVAALIVVLCIALVHGRAQSSVTADAVGDAPSTRPTWSFEAEAYLYLVEDGDYVLPVVNVEREALHLEARYNYEDFETFSAWVGWSFVWGSSLQLEAIPLAGVTVGRTNGFAPGLELTLSWNYLEFYSEGEFVFDLETSEGSFHYNWSELSCQTTRRLRLGLSTQYTRPFEGRSSLEFGLLAAFSVGPAEAMVYGFNLGSTDRYGILGVSYQF